jgi:SAM-dependent methyltransferase
MRNRLGDLVLAAPAAAAVMAAGAAGLAGASFAVCVLVAGTVGALGALQALVVVHLRRLRRRLDQVARELGAPVKATFASVAAGQRQREAHAQQDAAGTVWAGALPIPPLHLRFMTESEERFIATARSLAGTLADAGLEPESDVLDVGSGYGRLAVGLLDRIDFTGTYLGFDILARHVAWCANVITKADGRFQFSHLDLLNQRYNPTGALDPAEAVFPAADESVDVCALFSVFTHLYRPTVERYLQEITRVLRPGGIAVTSWLLFDDDRLASVTSDTSSYPLRLHGDDGSRFMLAEDPLRAIGFPQQDVEAMAAKAGLRVVRVERGNWDTGGADQTTSQFQDLVIMSREHARF